MRNIIKKFLSHKAASVRIILAIVFIVLVFIPLIRMFSNIDKDSFISVMTSVNFFKSITNSLIATSISTIITILLAYFLCVCIERTNIKYKSIFGIVFVLPMLIPSVSNGMGLVILFGNNGIITNLLDFNINIYGLNGIILGSVLYAFPVAFLMISDVMKYEDFSPYEAAMVLGIPKIKRFKVITLPYLRRPLIAIIFAIFTMIFTDYGVPLMVGGKYITIPIVMYQEVIGQLNFGKGSIYGCLLLMPAVIAFILDISNKDKGNNVFSIKPYEQNNSIISKTFAYIFCSIITIATVLPIFSFGVLAFTKNYPIDTAFTFSNITKTLNLRADEYLWNSILVALFVSIIGVLISFITAYMSARMKSKASKFLHLSTITSAAIPGIVLGLAYVLVFKGSIVYGTITILIMVNIIHFISSPYLMIYNSLSKLNENLEGVGSTLGIKRFYMIRDVFVPQCKKTLIEMFAYFFVNCMMTISAVSFLATTSNKPISLMINQFEAQMKLESAAVVSLMILIVNIIIKGIVYLIKNNKYHIFKNRRKICLLEKNLIS